MTFVIPDELFEAFVQWIRDFDTMHADCQLNMFAETVHNADANLEDVFVTLARAQGK